MTTLTLPILQDSYQVVDQRVTRSVDTKGGGPRRRLDLLDASVRVLATWKLSAAKYAALRTFYRTTTKRGALVFQAYLILDSSSLTLHDCNFVTGTFRLVSIDGGTYTVTAELEAIPAADDAGADATVMAAYAGTGS
jgi:hypothetical protein